MALLDDALDGIKDAIDGLLKNTGEWCANVLDTGVRYYNKFIAFAYELVTKDIKDDTFQEFWDVVNFLNSVFISIATTLLVSMFFYSLFESSMESRAEVSMWRTVFDYLKLLIANLLVTNSLNIITGIFKFGSNIAIYAVRTTNGNSVIINKDAGLNDIDKSLFVDGVSGLSGLFVFIIALIGAVVMIASAAMIIMEIIKRYFKMFTTLPFASLSFCTYILPDNKGGEMFRGYVKNAIAISLEAAIIVFCLIVSSSLIGTGATEGGLMNELLEISDTQVATKNSVLLENEEQAEEFEAYCKVVINFKAAPSGSAFDELGSDFDSYEIVPNDLDKYREKMKEAELSGSSSFEKINMMREAIYPATGYVTKTLDIGTALMLVMKCILPMILTAAVIKEVPSYASKVLGM